ncbi:IPT/TIG domain-containing protein [Nocardia higoensis]|uniref:IPT/TIG domain-containing protein n=1 Tax=Nocardia higoensis TaxID=228599 RepID=A0ABS0DC49_9NOCA|nr:IPT/TIG domain-containing protein [Nocardia higoensis]
MSDTQITAVAPAGTGIAQVTVTTVGGTSGGVPFTYVAAPVVAGLDPVSGPETGGTPVTITGTGFTGATAVSFGATPATSFIVVSDTQITAVAPAGTGIAQVTVTTVGGTSGGVPFTYVAAPVVAGLDPVSGPETGGTPVTITGTGFTDASAVLFGATPATSFTVVSDTQITATTPAGTGVEPVTVTTVGGVSNDVPFTYVAAPVVVGLDPVSGPETGGTVVTLTGTGFTGASAVSFGATPATSFTVVSDTQITAVAPAGTGIAQVTVTTVGGTSSGVPFTYVAAPVLASLDPTAGPETGGTVVTLTGTGFTGASAVSFGATPATSFTVVSDTQITAVAPAGTGVELVTVTTVGGVSSGVPFTYVAAPVVVGLDPVSGPETGGTVVTLTGTGFTGASAVSFGATPATSFTVVSDTQITATAPAGTGVELVTVTTVGGVSTGSPFAYVAAPVVASLDPTAGPETGGTVVTITGTGLSGATAVSFGATPATSFIVVSDTQITAIAPAGTGVQLVTVTTVGGTSSGVSYTYVAVPSVSGISPEEGPTVGGTVVTITGTGFTGASAVSFGATPATSFTVVSDTQITAVAPAGTGVELVTVTTIGGTSSGVPFTYVAAPVLASLDPTAGPETGGTVVTLTGAGFTGASAVSFGATPATSFTVVSDSEITATAPAGTGVELVTITTVGGVSTGLPFAYVAAPFVAGLDPAEGPETGGTVVTITGIGFAGATEVSFGATPATSFTVVSDTQITAAAPAGTGVEPVTVTTVGGVSNGSPFTYVAAPFVAGLDPAEGPETGGTVVTITGTGFTGATAVGFDTTPATSFTVVSDTEITAVAPAGTGVELVTVTTVGGISSGVPFTYVAAPVLASLDPTAGPETGGTVVTLTGAGFTEASAVSFGATPAASFTVVSDSEVTAVAPAGTGVESVTVTTVGGVSTGLPFTYVAAPVVAALDPAEGPETGGTVVTITGTGFTGAGAVTFGATPATLFTVVSDSEITAVAPAGTGVELVTVTTVGGVSTGSPFTYVAAPVLTSLDPTAGAAAGGTTVTLTGTGFTGATAVSFGATPATSFTVVSDSEITAVAPAGTGVEPVTVTTVGGVSTGLSFTFVVAPLLAALDPVEGPEAGGTTVTLTGTGFTGASAVTFGATPATSFTVVSDTQITATAPAGTGIEQVVVTTAGGASNGLPYVYIALPTIGSLSPIAGSTIGGDSVTIIGTGLSTTQSVTFDGVIAPFAVVSDLQITATTPAGVAGPADVVVTTTGGSATAAGAFTYVEVPEI